MILHKKHKETMKILSTIKLAELMRTIKKQDIITLVAYLNPKVLTVIGKHGERAISDNGKRIFEICGNNELTVGGN